jgi:hypothetical protein
MPDEVLRFDLDFFGATVVQDLSREVGWDSEPTPFMLEWESEALEVQMVVRARPDLPRASIFRNLSFCLGFDCEEHDFDEFRPLVDICSD